MASRTLRMTASGRVLFRNIGFEQMEAISQSTTAKRAEDKTNSKGSPSSGSSSSASTSYLIVDVRSAIEVKEMGIIPGAIHIPLNTFGDILQTCDGALANTEISEEQRDDIVSAEKEEREEFEEVFGVPKPTPATHTLVIYCQSGMRSMVASDIAEGLGYKGVLHYKGGFGEWARRCRDQ
jgi:rhodanese-related sulfurtransferase